MTEHERYETVDMPFYIKHVSPLLPEKILDFHAHAWKRDQWLSLDAFDISSSAGYMTTEVEYAVEKLLNDGGRIFPDKIYNAVCFGQPTPTANTELTNRYLAAHRHMDQLFPLRVTVKDMVCGEKLRQEMLENGFFGYKVFLDWAGNDYGNKRVEDMIGPVEMELADQMGLIVLLHVPGSGRLADPQVQKDVKSLSEKYPGANIVLAHCGRCYHPLEMKKAVDSIKKLENVYLDTSMVMDITVLEIVFDHIDSRRVLFGTDFPVAAMRGRRVNVMDHWVDVVLEGYPISSFRVSSNDIHASFMAYEIVIAVASAAEMAGIGKEKTKDIFCNNGMRLIGKVVHDRL